MLREATAPGLDLGVTVRAEQDAFARLPPDALGRAGDAPPGNVEQLRRRVDVVELKGGLTPAVAAQRALPAGFVDDDLLQAAPSLTHRLHHAARAAVMRLRANAAEGRPAVRRAVTRHLGSRAAVAPDSPRGD